MRMADGTVDGEAKEVEKLCKPRKRRPRRITDPEVLRARLVFMAKMRDAGTPLSQIGELFRCSKQNVHQLLGPMGGDDGGHRRTA